MRQRNQVFLLVSILATGSPSVALGYHSVEEKSLDDTAYTQRQGEFRLGLQKLSVGIFDPLTLSTYTLPWVLGAAAGSLLANVEAKFVFFQNDFVAIGGQVGLIYANVALQNDLDASFSGVLIPTFVNLSLRFDETWTWSTRLGYGFSRATAGTPPADRDVEGAAVASTLQLYSTIEMRQSKILSFAFTGRLAPFVAPIPVSGSASVDELTKITLDAEVDFEQLKLAAAFEVAALMSWQSFNLKLGLGYGAFFLPNTGLLIPGTYPVPAIDFYWRF